MSQEPLQLPPKSEPYEVRAPRVALKPPTPRHAKERNPIWGYIALGGYFAIAGFIGAFLGTLLANIL